MKQKNIVKIKTLFKYLNYTILNIVILNIINFIPIYGEDITLTAFDYPPFMDETLTKQGLFCELVSEAYKSVGYNVTFKFYPLKRSTRDVIIGEELAQLGTRWNFPENARNNDVQFIPLFYYRVVGFYLKDRIKNVTFKTLKDLKGYRLGVIAGSSDAAILNKYPELNLEIEEVQKIELLFKKLYKNRSDILFTVELSGLTFISKYYPNEQGRWMMTDDAIQGILADVIFSKRYPNAKKYMNAFKRGIKKIQKNGIYYRLFEKYYGLGKVPDIVDDLDKEIYEIPKE